jgi:hypothetical protein
MDNLEKFIKDNRDHLDKYDPSPEVWKKISRKTARKYITIPAWIAAAAIITVVFGISLVIYNMSSGNRAESISENQFQGELRETEFFYNTMVNSLYQEAKPLLSGQPDIKKELDYDLGKIDRICDEIKEDLKDNVANEEVLEALIQNYTIKIRILEDLLNTLKENENETGKSKSDEL